MKKLKRWLAALLVGEFITLWHTDKTFKKNVQKASSPADKLKTVFDGLFDFNKKVIWDIQQSNLEDLKSKAITWFTRETELLEEKLTARESEFGSRSDEKLPIYLMGLEDQFKTYEKKALSRKQKLIDDYELESKVEMFRKRIVQAQKSLEEKKSS